MRITHLSGKEIDREAWDSCINADPSGLPYMYAEMLDIFSQGKWSALMSDDYRLVFPLPFNNKYIVFPQVYQPILFQQGGIAGPESKTNTICAPFLEAIPETYRKVNLSLKADNQISDSYTYISRTNLILDLTKGREALWEGYKGSLRRSIRKAAEQGIEVLESVGMEKERSLLDLVANYYVPLSPSTQKMGAEKFLDLLKRLINTGKTIGLLATDEGGQPIAGAVLLTSGRRASLITSATSPEGRELEATHALIDFAIERCIEKGIQIFDFEGSQVPGVRKFYMKFGPEEETYSVVKRTFGRWQKANV